MSLNEKQGTYMLCIARFILWACEELPEAYDDVEEIRFTAGDFWARTGHHPRSTHYKRLGADMNLFVDGEWISTYDGAPEIWDDLGAKWESMDPRARWGGRFGDLNHYSFEHEGVQ